MEIKESILTTLYEINEEEKQKNEEILTSSYFVKENNNFIILKNKILTTDHAIHLRKHPRFIDYPEHTHEYIECSYVISGTITHIIEEKEYILTAGDFIVFAKDAKHAIRKCEINDIAMNFIVKPQFLKKIIDASSNDTNLSSFLLDSLLLSNKQTFFIFEQISQDLKSQVNTIINHYFSNQLSQSINLLFTYILIELFTKNLNKNILINEQLILYTKEYIENEYLTGDLETLSKQLNTNYSYLSSCIKKEFGLSFKQLLQKKRLAMALKLIQQTKIPIKEIAFMVGYENMTFFYRIFKQEYHKNPNSFRSSNKK